MDNTTLNLLIAILCFVSGFVGGWIIRGVFSKLNKEDTGKMMVGLMVTLVWMMSVIFELFNSDYHTNPALHGLMGLVAGYYFGLNKLLGDKNGIHKRKKA